MLLVAFCKSTHPYSLLLLTEPSIFHFVQISTLWWPCASGAGAKPPHQEGIRVGSGCSRRGTTAIANDWFGCGTFFLAVSQEKSLPMYIESYWKKQHLEKT